MSYFNGPKFVTNGLGFYIDIANSKSCIGEPTTNYFFTPTPDANRAVTFSVNGTGTFYRIYTGSYGGYEIKPTDVVYKYDLGTLGCHYHGNDYNVPSGSPLTFAFDYYVDAVGYPSTNFLGNIENGGNGLSSSTTDPSPTVQRVWKRAIMSPVGTSTGTGYSRFLLYPGACPDTRLAESGYILYKNPQAEPKSSPTAYVPTGASTTGSRSTTQAIIDLTGTQVCNVGSSLGFTGDFGGAVTGSGVITNNITITNSRYYDLNNHSFTYMAWAKVSSDSAMAFYEARGDSLVGTLWLVNYGGAGHQYLFFTDKPYSGQKGYLSASSPGSVTGSVHYFAVSVNRTSQIATFYFDGVSLGNTSTTNTSGSITPDSGFRNVLMYDLGGAHFNGSMYNFSIYPERALDAREIRQNYNAQKSRFGRA